MHNIMVRLTKDTIDDDIYATHDSRGDYILTGDSLFKTIDGKLG
tara:strand:- start:541 stop:672 length:132 start_codon:yes stop_codon:yes gene_type:complete